MYKKCFEFSSWKRGQKQKCCVYNLFSVYVCVYIYMYIIIYFFYLYHCYYRTRAVKSSSRQCSYYQSVYSRRCQTQHIIYHSTLTPPHINLSSHLNSLINSLLKLLLLQTSLVCALVWSGTLHVSITTWPGFCGRSIRAVFQMHAGSAKIQEVSVVALSVCSSLTGCPTPRLI